MPLKEAKTDEIQLRSESVQEILTAPPSWMLSWSNGIIMILIIGFLGCCWFIRYPDVVRAEVRIAGVTGAVDIRAKEDFMPGRLFVKSNMEVQKGQTLLVSKDAGSVEDIVALNTLVEEIDLDARTFPKLPSLNVRDLNPLYILFKRDLHMYYKQKLSRSAMLDLLESQAKLKAALQHIIVTAPSSGRVRYNETLLHQTAMIKKHEWIFTILPENAKDNLKGIIKLPAAQLSKIRKGQRVMITLTPSARTFEGSVEEVPVIDNEKGQYDVLLHLPNNLKDTEKYSIQLKWGMTGKAKIITADMRLIERIVNKVFMNR